MNPWPEIRDTSLLYEDEAILALNKPSGISVMGERHDVDLVALAEECGERLYPVHRIDKVTSGIILFAKELRFHAGLTRQFNKRTVDKLYLAVTDSSGTPHGPPEKGIIDLPLTTGRKNRVRVAGNRGNIAYDEKANRWFLRPEDELENKRKYPSLTTFARVWHEEQHALLAVRPVTGRRHQIRVHLAWIGHPIEGDPLLRRNDSAESGNTCLHSWRLEFDAEWTGTRMSLEAPPGEDFWRPLPKPFALSAELLVRAQAALPPVADGSGLPQRY